MRTLLIRIAVLTALLSGLLLPGTAMAGTNLFSDACRQGGGDSTACQTGGNASNPLTGPDGVIIKAANILAVVAGFAAVIFLVVGGIKYITSGGDSSAISSAKNTIIYALVGIAVIVVSRSLLGFVLNKL